MSKILLITITYDNTEIIKGKYPLSALTITWTSVNKGDDGVYILNTLFYSVSRLHQMVSSVNAYLKSLRYY